MILVCGEALIDLFVGRPSSTGLPTEAVAGGSPFNLAVGLARLGCSTAFLSTISDDAFGDFLIGRLTEAGVGTGYLRRCSSRSTLSVVATGVDGHPHYSFYAEAGADRALTIDDLPALPASCTAIAAGSYALGVEPIAGAIEALLCREAGNRVVSLDPNVRPRVIGDVAVFRQRFEGLLGTATIVKASIEDIELLYGPGSPRTVAQGWLARGPSLVVVTLGADGALAFTRDGPVVERPSRPVAVLDTVGAGDTFHAALLAFLDRAGRLSPQGVSALTQKEIAGALDFAAAAAAMVCMRRGADCPTWPEVDAFMTREP